MSGILFFSFTLSKSLISISFGLLAFSGILGFSYKSLTLAQKRLCIAYIVFFLLIAVSVFNSENTDEALRKLLLKSPLLLFPFVLSTFSRLKTETRYLLAFICSYALYLPAVVSVYNYFLNKELFDDLILQSKPLPVEMGYGIYHIQFSIILAGVILLGLISLRHMYINSRLNVIFYALALMVVVNIFSIHILSARTGLIGLYAGVGIWLLSLTGHIKKGTLRWVLPLVVLIPLALYFLSSSLRNRILNTVDDFNVVMEQKDPNDYSFALRVRAWQNAANVIKQHPFTGVGLGDAEQVLYEQFALTDPAVMPQNRKNPHFQLMETAVQSGLICALAYLFIFILMFFRDNKSINIHMLCFGALFFIASCFESILERQASVVAFVFFIGMAEGLFRKSTPDPLSQSFV